MVASETGAQQNSLLLRFFRENLNLKLENAFSITSCSMLWYTYRFFIVKSVNMCIK